MNESDRLGGGGGGIGMFGPEPELSNPIGGGGGGGGGAGIFGPPTEKKNKSTFLCCPDDYRFMKLVKKVTIISVFFF